MAAERAGLGYFRLGRSRRTTAREGPLRDVSAYPGADAWPGRDVPHATSRSYPLTPSGTEVLARLRTAPLAASVPKPSEVESQTRSERRLLVRGPRPFALPPPRG